MTQTWIQSEGYCDEFASCTQFAEDVKSGDTRAVAFKPFNGLPEVFCECVAVYGNYVVLDVPPKGTDENSLTEWFKPYDRCTIIAPIRFLHAQ